MAGSPMSTCQGSRCHSAIPWWFHTRTRVLHGSSKNPRGCFLSKHSPTPPPAATSHRRGELLCFLCQGHSIALCKKEMPLGQDLLCPRDRLLPNGSKLVSLVHASSPSLAEQGWKQPLRQARGSSLFSFLQSWVLGSQEQINIQVSLSG